MCADCWPPVVYRPKTPWGHKRCSGCDTIRPFADFGRNRARAGGMQHACRDCRARAERERVPATRRPIPEAKRCPTCQTTKAAEAFSLNASRVDGLSTQCRSCRRATRRRRGEIHQGTVPCDHAVRVSPVIFREIVSRRRTFLVCPSDMPIRVRDRFVMTDGCRDQTEVRTVKCVRRVDLGFGVGVTVVGFTHRRSTRAK